MPVRKPRRIGAACRLHLDFHCRTGLLARSIGLGILVLLMGRGLGAQGPTESGLTSRAERIVGRVTTDSGRAIAGAVVIATMAPDRTVRQDTTDATGGQSVAPMGGSAARRAPHGRRGSGGG